MNVITEYNAKFIRSFYRKQVQLAGIILPFPDYCNGKSLSRPYLFITKLIVLPQWKRPKHVQWHWLKQLWYWYQNPESRESGIESICRGHWTCLKENATLCLKYLLHLLSNSEWIWQTIKTYPQEKHKFNCILIIKSLTHR